MKEKPYKIRKKRGPIFTFFKNVFKLFKKKPEIINLGNEEIKDQALFIANHSAASGPLTYELFFPKYFIPWGTHEMCGNYKSRWNYLYHTFYRQKLHYGKVKSFIIATIFASFSHLLYRSTGLIGTYKDSRLASTFKKSFQVLDENLGILIFPEDSTNGYFDLPIEYFQGFVYLAKAYYKKRKIDLPVYNIYYNKKTQKIFIQEPMYVNKLLEQGKTEKEISDIFLKRAHELFNKYSVPQTKTA